MSASVLNCTKYSSEVPCTCISIFCYFILPLRYILEVNTVHFTHHMYLITLDTGYFADYMLHQ